MCLSFLDQYSQSYAACQLCPRACAVDRAERVGVCGASDVLKIGRAALHWWEEPCLVGNKGSGAIFFAHCALGCVYCQNKELAQGSGVEVSARRLREIMLELQDDQHAANINLVTASHYAPTVAAVLKDLREEPPALMVPVVWNTAGYESVQTLELLDGLVDIYLVDLKYAKSDTAARLSHAADYPEVALRAIRAMIDQVGAPVSDGEGYLKKGVIIRHLVLPGYVDEPLAVLETIQQEFKGQVLVSIMNQFTIVDESFDPEAYGLGRVVSDEDYERVLTFADSLGMDDYFWQEGGAAKISFVPAFDGTGVVSS